jgi:hypothetical protein
VKPASRVYLFQMKRRLRENGKIVRYETRYTNPSICSTVSSVPSDLYSEMSSGKCDTESELFWDQTPRHSACSADLDLFPPVTGGFRLATAVMTLFGDIDSTTPLFSVQLPKIKPHPTGLLTRFARTLLLEDGDSTRQSWTSRWTGQCRVEQSEPQDDVCRLFYLSTMESVDGTLLGVIKLCQTFI